ncbi:Zinc finger HIT domain-containing protein 2 [Amphibalanus amphitrite]|uniref:Zinc finger HIT domain-containing protein 2 n=1 Tax=Amphibalanus amphitrite TaxID=1232801 RepID=A0A6A4W176_AMPAM|nr:zinc finger HIT domain-containing protein 2-like [Amphibalanus amphitrite]XP_043230471.1 zinc finger HIT domain-containing protein 2-like [Amphibalanus amphitrite]XP_043230472.1 zinc finger HIT domain-containing protein 2-like [Amphibalanus amphitrite]KAF0298989.1 Zinc finger HIT domain-containing protein 2 [Amphibalanus amphitrite]
MSSEPCAFCEGSSRYVCPRCGVPYCSVTCYRSGRHQRCSEGFYRDCVQQQLRAEHADPALRRRTEEALARQARLQAAQERGEEPPGDQSDEPPGDQSDEPVDSDDSDAEEELAERLRGVDLDDSEAVWARLTPAERDEFRRRAAAGDIAAEPWRPWWTVRAERPKVAELGAEPTPEFVTAAPALLTHVPPLTALTKQTPSPLVVNSVINVLYAYAQLRLLWDGDWTGAALPVADALCRICGCLARGEVMKTSRDAVDAVDFCLGESGLECDAALRRQSRQAVQQLLTGPCTSDAGWYVLAALSDLWRLLEEALGELRAGRHRERSQPASFGREFGTAAAAAPAVSRAELRRMQRKLDYLFAWSRSNEQVLAERAAGPQAKTEVVVPTAGSASGD